MSKTFQINFYLPSFYMNMQKNHTVWSSCFWDTADLRISKSDSLRAFSQYPTKIYKSSFTFLESTSVHQKSSCFINSSWRFSCFKNFAIWFARNIFDHTKLNIFKSIFTFLQSISVCKKLHWLILSWTDLKISKFEWQQGSFISEMEWAPFKSLFWNNNDSIVKIRASIKSGVSLWHRPCYKNKLNYDNGNKLWKFITI